MKSREEAELILGEMERIVASAKQNLTAHNAPVAAAKMLIDLMDLGVRTARKGLQEGAFDD